jgi:hypothetical protein
MTEINEHIPAALSFDVGVVCEIPGRTKEERNANARLIAAAPDLLAALRGLLAISERYTNVGLEEFDAARAAIRKAVASC